MLVKGKKYRGTENDEKDKLSEKEEERIRGEEKEKEEVEEDGKGETRRK
jgi:hypothetical protein